MGALNIGKPYWRGPDEDTCEKSCYLGFQWQEDSETGVRRFLHGAFLLQMFAQARVWLCLSKDSGENDTFLWVLCRWATVCMHFARCILMPIALITNGVIAHIQTH